MLPPRRDHISRLEAFSDAVFAFALTLLVVALEVPRSYAELMVLLGGFASFACCFALLVWIWHEHNMFFRRYGLQDGVTVALNGALLFVVLFYVYPLKFMFDALFDRIIPAVRGTVQPMTLPQLGRAAAVYAFGFVVLFVMFALLYWRAYGQRRELELTPLEVFDARAFIGYHVVSATIGVLAIAVALLAPQRFAPLSPMCFMLMGPAHWVYGAWTTRRRQAAARAFSATLTV